ncbi:hypothetical protein NP233_g8393 [Leucocoprinus birnbaumii]|uniref:tRNA (guanine(26)-N(2))-dimethyltransferase n=1 Tax=Leucocoprinus birnbaumii TaxID=56174 RepID=A0AAD5VR04_9AGAR|nr:hypothetical protein NP233_g8393 [Leucocoprinus birnbaumii]
MDEHSMSPSSELYAYLLWVTVGCITLLFTLAHSLDHRSGICGARCSRLLLGRERVPGRISWLYDRLKCRRIKAPRTLYLPSNRRLLGLLLFTVIVVMLAFTGPDYIPPAQNPEQPSILIQKSWWTSAGRTGIMAFTLLPLCILFALKGSPFAVFSYSFLTHLHFDKLAWLHRWSAGLAWFLTAYHVGAWSAQLVLDKHPLTGQTVYSTAWSYAPFVHGWVAFILLTILIILSLRPICSHHYEIFYASHVFLVPSTLIAIALHHLSVSLPAWCALAVWVGDRTWRAARYLHINYTISPYKQWRGRRANPRDCIPLGPVSCSAYNAGRQRYCPPPGFAHAEIVAGSTVRSTYAPVRDFTWAPGQYFLINIPSISRFTTHPFTSATTHTLSNTPVLVFLVRVKSGFTKKLWKQVIHLSSRGLVYPAGDQLHGDVTPPASGALFRTNVDGPFGSAARVKWNTYTSAVIIVGGSGVSYGVSVLDHLCQLIRRRKARLQQSQMGPTGSMMARARFVWIIQEFGEMKIAWANSDLTCCPILGQIQWAASALRRFMSWGISDELVVDIFVTRPKFRPTVGPRIDFGHETGRSQTESEGLLLNTTDAKISASSKTPHKLRRMPNFYLHANHTEKPETEVEATDFASFEGDEHVEVPGERRFNKRIRRESKVRRARSQEQCELYSKDLPRATTRGSSSNQRFDTLSRPMPTASVPVGSHRRAASGTYSLPQARASSEMKSIETLPSRGKPQLRLASTTPMPKNASKPLNMAGDTTSLDELPTVEQYPIGGSTFRLKMSDTEMDDIKVVSEFAHPGKPNMTQILWEEVNTAEGPIIVALAASSIEVPDGFRLHTENNSHILLSANDAFLNPVQEFNRDTSVACIRTWSEDRSREKEEAWRKAMQGRATRAANKSNKKLKGDDGQPIETTSTQEPAKADDTGDQPQEGLKMPEPAFRPSHFTLLEALSATGLRSIRYAKEIPLLKYVIANDLSDAAAETMRRNVELNGLGPFEESSADPAIPSKLNPGKVRVNEGDACTLMYNHREEKKRVDVVDLDPYGTAAPFLDAAVQCVSDGGLLCVTCTDLAVLATTNYPEKCFSNYGGVSVKAEYAHEAALRLVLHSLSTTAARYGRYIEPVISLSIDFYVRVFVRVRTGAMETKKALSKAANYYVCSHCQAWYEQPLGRIVEKVHEKSGHVNYLFKTQAGPTVSEKCPECESTLHIAGPMWSGPLHDSGFVGRVLEHLEEHKEHYGTAARMKGMLTLAKEVRLRPHQEAGILITELVFIQEIAAPFYFTASKLASAFHCSTPPLTDIASALLNAGYKVSRSHACAGSLKTTAPHRDIHDVIRGWIKKNPVKMQNIGEGSPARRLLAKEPILVANFKRHPDSVTPSSEVKLVRYQQNPTPFWGPKPKAVSGTGNKRKRDEAEGVA